MRREQNSQAPVPGGVIAVAVDGGCDRNAGVVDDNIDPAEMRRDLVDDSIDVIAVGNVQRPGFRGSAPSRDLCGDGVSACGGIVRHGDAGAFGREHPRGGAADAAGRAGDENGQSRDRAAELLEIGHAFLLWDFSGKQVLVVGGSSGIGNGIAQAFRAKGARVQVCGTRASAADYSASEGSQLGGLDYAQLDVSDAKAIENFKPSFDRLDVLVMAQGAVIYRRGEFEMAGFRKVLEVNLMSLMACAMRF